MISILRRHTDFMLILLVFVSFRLMALFGFSPGGFLTNYADHLHYYSIAQLLVVFFCLPSILMFLRGRHILEAVALGLRAPTKYAPQPLLSAILRFSPSRAVRAKYLLVASTVVTIGLLPLLLVSPSYVLGSLRILAVRPPWETVGALIDGNFDIARLGPVENRTDLTGGPAGCVGTVRLLCILATLALGALCLYVILRKRILVNDTKGLIILSAMMVCVFFLWSKGWSPGWLVLLIPFVLLVFPTGRGVLYCLTLSFIKLLEWPILFVAAPDRKEVFAVVVVARTLVFVLLLADLYQELGRDVAPARSR